MIRIPWEYLVLDHWKSSEDGSIAMRLTTAGSARNFRNGIVGRVATKRIPVLDRGEYVRLFAEGAVPEKDLEGYRAILSHKEIVTDRPVIECLRETDHFTEGDIVVLEGANGFVRSLYRPHESHHSLFVTEHCSSNCLMCSQPPKDKDDVDGLAQRNRRLIELMKPAPEYLTITGGGSLHFSGSTCFI
jgi:hypothetical protein